MKLWQFVLLAVLLLFLLQPQQAQAERRTVIYRGSGTFTSGENILGEVYRPAPGVTHVEITLGLVSTNSVMRVDWNGEDFNLNSGTALTAGNAYTFPFGVSSGNRYRIEPATGTTVYWVVTEVHDQ